MNAKALYLAAALSLAAGRALASCPADDFGGCRAQCEQGDPDSCSTLGTIYRHGTVGIERDEMRAVELYRKACALGSADGCANERTMYREGRGFEPIRRKR